MPDQTKISVVIPVYGCGSALEELYHRLSDVLCKMVVDYEIILVNDGSQDGSWEIIEQIAGTDPRVKGINFTRNFGQHYAITAGLDHCDGEWVVVMDCDLQDLPEEIPKLYDKAIEEGRDIVLARRKYRSDKKIKIYTGRLFYYVLGKLTGWNYDSSIANFGIYSKTVINNFNQLREIIRVFPVMVHWLGFPAGYVDVVHGKRKHGRSSYDFRKRLWLAINIILAYSDKPLRLLIRMGLIISLLSVLFTVIVIIRYFTGNIAVSGYTSIIASVWFLSGLIIFTLGVVGLYIAKIFESVKNRPLYVIKNKINVSK